MESASIVLTLSLLSAGLIEASEAAKVPVETFELSNGMKFLAVVRPELATVSAGFVARVGSANAFTSEDVTVYFLTVPANKLELWFWMESDRLLSPVFREFFSERDVVQEEIP